MCFVYSSSYMCVVVCRVVSKSISSNVKASCTKFAHHSLSQPCFCCIPILPSHCHSHASVSSACPDTDLAMLLLQHVFAKTHFQESKRYANFCCLVPPAYGLLDVRESIVKGVSTPMFCRNMFGIHRANKSNLENALSILAA